MTMKTVDVKWETTDFRRALDRYMKGSRRDIGTVMRQQCKKIIESVAMVMPPSSAGSVAPAKARKQGETRIRGDLQKLFVKTRRSPQETNLASIHKANRNSRGRVRRVSQKFPVSPADFNAYQKLVLARVGLLASGWKAAATALGSKLPAWIRRHNGPGDASVRDAFNGVTVTATNKVRYASSGDNDRRVKWAIARQARKLRSQIDRQLSNNARRF
jgi:hypothetical protein